MYLVHFVWKNGKYINIFAKIIFYRKTIWTAVLDLLTNEEMFKEKIAANEVERVKFKGIITNNRRTKTNSHNISQVQSMFKHCILMNKQ